MDTIHSHKGKLKWWGLCISLEKRASTFPSYNITHFISHEDTSSASEPGNLLAALSEEHLATQSLSIMGCKPNQVKTQGSQ